jgi:Domain of Unknown Function (DUF1259)
MRIAIASILILVLVNVQADASDAPGAPIDWKPLVDAMGDGGVLKDDVYTYTVPRKDLNVVIDGMDVPTAAGLASVFYFYKCPCGHMQVVGQFCCAEYEADDVIDALRVGAMIRITSVGNMFSGDHPKITIVRFQGDGDAASLAKLIKSAQDWMGEARTKPATRPAGSPNQ